MYLLEEQVQVGHYTRGRVMATILVDYENVACMNGLRGSDVLQDTDTLIIFYSGCCSKIRSDYMQDIRDSGCRFHIVKLKQTGKNALDFYIATECGIVSERGEEQIAIISNDKGFEAVVDFFRVNSGNKNVQVVRANNIEVALTCLNAPEDSVRRQLLHNRMATLDLAAECAKIEEENRMCVQIQNIFVDTLYEDRVSEVIDFMKEWGQAGRHKVYTGALQRFGKTDGTRIYNILKEKIMSKNRG